MIEIENLLKRLYDEQEHEILTSCPAYASNSLSTYHTIVREVNELKNKIRDIDKSDTDNKDDFEKWFLNLHRDFCNNDLVKNREGHYFYKCVQELYKLYSDNKNLTSKQ